MLTWRTGLGVFCCICGHFLEFFPVCFVCLPFSQQGCWEKWRRGKGQHGWGLFLHPGMWPAPPDHLPNNVIIRKLEKERVHLGGRNSRIKETKHRPSEGDSAVSSPNLVCLTHQWQNDGSLSQRLLKWLLSLYNHCAACFWAALWEARTKLEWNKWKNSQVTGDGCGHSGVSRMANSPESHE